MQLLPEKFFMLAAAGENLMPMAVLYSGFGRLCFCCAYTCMQHNSRGTLKNGFYFGIAL